MQVAELAAYGAQLQVVERPTPAPGPGQVRVRVLAAAVNPADWLTASGALAAMTAQIPLPLVLGWDVTGEIDAVGEGARYQVGQRVAAMVPWFDTGSGTYAEAIVLDPSYLAVLPEGADPVAAATIPLNGQTAQQALDLVALPPGQRLLITGASGGVGGFAVQLAAAAGARVLAVASRGDEDRVRELGAAEVLSRSDDLADAVRQLASDGVDAVLDAVPVGPQLLGAVRDGGTFVTVLDFAAPASERGIRVDKVSVTPNPEQLRHLLGEFAAGRLVTRVAQELPLAEAAKALELASAGGLAGKVVLVP